MRNQTENKSVAAAILLSLAVFLYILVRAVLISFNHDEALTVACHASTSFFSILTYALPMASNSNFYTVLVKIIKHFNGCSEFLYRLPALLCAPLFFLALYKILRRSLNGPLLLLAYAFIVTQPFLLDLFGRARGYGPGLAFMMLAIYAFLRTPDSDMPDFHRKLNCLTALFLCLSIGFQLSYGYPFIAVIGLILLREFRYAWSLRAKPVSVILQLLFDRGTIIFIPSLMFSLWAVLVPSILMRENYELYFGGERGFWEDTVLSLLQVILYRPSFWHFAESTLLSVLIGVIVFLITTGFLIRRIRIQDFYDTGNRDSGYLLGMLLLTSFAISAGHILLHGKYAMDRTAVTLLPLFLCCLILITKQLFLTNRFSGSAKSVKIIGRCLLASAIFFNLSNFNISTQYQGSDGSMKAFTRWLVENRYQDRKSVMVGMPWQFENSFNFYRTKYNLLNLTSSSRKPVGPDSTCDIYYLDGAQKNLIDKYKLKTVRYFMETDTYIAIPSRF